MTLSLTNRLETFFKERPGEWTRAEALMEVAGNCAWRTRVSNLRKRGMVIENDVLYRLSKDGKPYRISVYRYIPPAVGQQELSL